MAFVLEDPALDIAILEVGQPATPGQHIRAWPVSFARPLDGSKVLTIGFPAPEISGGNVDQDGRFLGVGQFFLKSHGNEGILAAQYELSGHWYYEFNVGWHHGESGGPVFQLRTIAAFAVMQHYRNVKTPHGVFPAPHRGIALDCIEPQLIELSANVL